MASGSLSYGTVQIGVRDASRLKSGDQYTYKIISGYGTNVGGYVLATKINGIIYLLDSQNVWAQLQHLFLVFLTFGPIISFVPHVPFLECVVLEPALLPVAAPWALAGKLSN